MTVQRQELTSLASFSSALLAAALDNLGVPVVMTDINLEPPGPFITFVNHAFEKLTGYDADELIGRSPRLLQGPETSRDNLDRLRRCLSEGRFFEARDVNYRKDGASYDFEWIITPVLDGGQIVHWISLQRDMTSEREALQFLSSEVQHRTRNMLGVVSSLATQTLSNAADMQLFQLRLQALSRAQTCLSRDPSESVSLEALIAGEFRALRLLSDKVKLRGPAVALPRPTVETLVLVVHELASHATRSLHAAHGEVSVVWTRVDRRGRPVLVLRWRERGAAPEPDSTFRDGYSRELIERALPFSLRAMSQLALASDGLFCEIELPL